MFRLLYAAALLTCLTAAQAAEVQVAVASNFAAPMQKIAAAFEKETGHTVRLSFGATGKFYAQIVSGAPFEVLLAADDTTPARLEMEHRAVAGSRFTYAVGTLVLWSARPGFVDAEGRRLREGAFERLAIADPKLAPYGAAALETLSALKLTEAVQGKLIGSGNIAQAYQYVVTGNADLGFVALSQVFENGRIGSGSGWIVPPHLHTPIRQDAVLLETSRGKPAAEALLRYLRSDAARAIIRGYGYGE